jgi:hypothetical protein
MFESASISCSKRSFGYEVAQEVEQYDLKRHSFIGFPSAAISNVILKLLLNCSSQVMFSCFVKKNDIYVEAKEGP